MRPPRLARWILRILLPTDLRDAFLGDLEERFRQQARHDPSAARRAYWREIFSTQILRLRSETKGMHLPPGAPPASARGDNMISTLLNDLKFAFRTMAKAPAFTAVAVLSLAVGIGPNTAIFSLVDAILFQDWGVREPETVVDMYSLTPEGQHYLTSYSVYELIEEGAEDVFTDVAATRNQYTGIIEIGGQGRLYMGELVTGNYFDVLGVQAVRGRTFLPEEDATPGTHPVVVISYRLWQQGYGGDPDLVGGEIRLNGRPYTVVGIAPDEFKGRVAPGIGTDFWAPIRMYPHLSPSQMSAGNLMFIGRLRPGVSMARARSVLDAVAARFNEQRPDSRSELAIGAVNLAEIRLHPDLDGFITGVAALLFAAVGLLLLVACVNMAGFLLARATDRRKEMAVRVAMGAGRRDILRQLLVESLVLAALGGAAGLLLGMGAIRLLLAVEIPLGIPINLDVGLNGRLLLFTGVASVAAAVLFGLTPALEASRAPVAATLRDESGSSGGRRKTGARGAMVAAQMAFSTVLLFGAGLFIRSLANATDIDVGFDTGPAAVVAVEAWASEMPDEEVDRFRDDLLRGAAASPGIERVAATGRMPLDLGNSTTSLEIPGVEPPPDRDRHVIQLTGVSPGYLETMGIPLVEGRDFNDGDVEGSQQVAILTRAAAQRYWPGESALGRVLYRHGNTDDALTVVGVAEDAKLWSLTETPRPFMYLPMAQHSLSSFQVVARGNLPPQRMAEAIQAEAKRLYPDIFLSEVGTMSDHLSYIFFLPRMAAVALALVGVLALLMACIGLYGMVSYAVARRTHEMGIRLALGAERGMVVALMLKVGLGLVAVGGVVGLLGALGLGGLMEGWLYGVEGTDPVALLAAPAVLGLVALVAAYLPARRASRVNPVEALKSE